MMLLQQPTVRSDVGFPLEVYPFEGAMVAKSVDQTVATGLTGATMTWASATYDTGAFWSAGSPTRLTVPAAGYAQVFGGGRWASVTSATARGIKPLLNGAEFAGGGGMIVAGPISASGSRLAFASALVPVVAGDYFEMNAAHARGSNLSMQAHSLTYFGIRYVPDAYATLVELTAAESVTGGTLEYLDWDATVFDNMGAWSAGDPSKLVVPNGFPHRLMFHAGVRWQNTGGSVNMNVDRGTGSRPGLGGAECAGPQSTFGTRQSVSGCPVNCQYDGVGAPDGTGTDTVPNFYRLQVGTSATQNVNAQALTYFGIEALPGTRQTMIKIASSQSIATSTQTPINFGNRVLYDDAGCFDPAQPTRLTVPAWYTSGYALLVANISWGTATAGERWLELHKNGSGIFPGGAGNFIQPSTLDRTRHNLWTIVPVVAGDYFEVAAWQSSGSAESVAAGNTSVFAMTLLP